MVISLTPPDMKSLTVNPPLFTITGKLFVSRLLDLREPVISSPFNVFGLSTFMSSPVSTPANPFISK